jgi:hypothetical protein
MIKFTLVTAECGDWEALYIDGQLAAEGHRVSAKDALKAINKIIPSVIERYDVPDEIAEMEMPENLNDLAEHLIEY